MSNSTPRQPPKIEIEVALLRAQIESNQTEMRLHLDANQAETRAYLQGLRLILDERSKKQDDQIADIKAETASNTDRIGKLENMLGKFVAVGAGIALVFTTLGAWFADNFTVFK